MIYSILFVNILLVFSYIDYHIIYLSSFAYYFRWFLEICLWIINLNNILIAIMFTTYQKNRINIREQEKVYQYAKGFMENVSRMDKFLFKFSRILVLIIVIFIGQDISFCSMLIIHYLIHNYNTFLSKQIIEKYLYRRSFN